MVDTIKVAHLSKSHGNYIFFSEAAYTLVAQIFSAFLTEKTRKNYRTELAGQYIRILSEGGSGLSGFSEYNVYQDKRGLGDIGKKGNKIRISTDWGKVDVLEEFVENYLIVEKK